MKKKKLEKKEKILIASFFISLIHFGLTFLYDNQFFNYTKITKNIVITNTMFYIALNFFWYYMIKIFTDIKKYKNRIITFFIYFGFMMIMLALVFPGVWRWDDTANIYYAQHYSFFYWQHTFSTIYFIIAYKFIPVAYGITIVQSFLISAIISYILNDVFEKTKEKKTVYKILLLIPFLLPTIIDHNLYTLRLVMYSYIILLMVYLSIKYYKNKEKLDCTQLVFLSFLYFLAITWRSEGIFFAITYITTIIIFNNKKMLKKITTIIVIIAMLICIREAKKFNESYNNDNTKNYVVASTIEPLVPLIEKAQKDNRIEDLDNIGRVINIDVITEHISMRGIDIVNRYDVFRTSYTEDEYKTFMKTYAKLILKYPGTFLKERFSEYIRTNGIINNVETCTSDASVFLDEGKNNLKNVIDNQHGNLTPKNNKLRKTILRILEGRNIQDSRKTNRITFPLFWNAIPPTAVIIIAMIICIYQKRKYEAFIYLSILVKTVIVFLTSPASFFVYYLPEYIIGYFGIVYNIVMSLDTEKRKEK